MKGSFQQAWEEGMGKPGSQLLCLRLKGSGMKPRVGQVQHLGSLFGPSGLPGGSEVAH